MNFGKRTSFLIQNVNKDLKIEKMRHLHKALPVYDIFLTITFSVYKKIGIKR